MRQPPAKVKNRQIAFVFCFGLPSVWERSTKLRIHRSHSCNFFYRSYSRILAPYCNSSHITKAIAIEWGVKSSLYKCCCYMITYPSVLRSPSVFRVWAAIPSEYMALSQTFSVTSHMSLLYLWTGSRGFCMLHDITETGFGGAHQTLHKKIFIITSSSPYPTRLTLIDGNL